MPSPSRPSLFIVRGMRPESLIRAALALLLCCGLSSCVTRDSGYKISEETIAFIKPGRTTEAEVIENLGPPLIEFKDLRVCAYSWGKVHVASSGKGSMPMETTDIRQGNQVGPPPDEGTLIETRRWLCCIAFDEKGEVTRVQRITVEGARSVEQALRDWAKGH
jgi:hypothetical protein